MESFAFPDEVHEIINYKLQIGEYFLCFLKLRKKVVLFTGNIRKTPFSILIITQREMHQSKKGQRKNLAQAIFCKAIPKGTLQNVLSGNPGQTNISDNLGI